MEETFDIGGELTVGRLGFGAMRVCGEGIWGPPDDPDAAIELLQHVVELGVTLIDTADAYGPEVSENLIAEALHPYPDELVIATKGGLVRGGPGNWQTNGRPDHLIEACNASLDRLKLDTIDLYQLHAIDDDVPMEESLGALVDLQQAGKIRFIGVSNFSLEELERAVEMADVVTVQNKYNLGFREYDDVLDYCDEHEIGFIPWYPLDVGKLASHDQLEGIADQHQVTPLQVALAWLMHRSSVVLPIPGTSSQKHLKQNVEAAEIELSEEELALLDAS